MAWLWLGLMVLAGLFLAVSLTGAPYVPSHRRSVAEAFTELRPLTSGDTLVDIGSGDGIVCLVAAQQGARVYGYEINPLLVLIARLRLRRYRTQATVLCRNLWQVDFPAGTSVVYTFGTSHHIGRMYAKVQQQAARLGHPIDLVSYGFAVPGVPPAARHGAHVLYHVVP